MKDLLFSSDSNQYSTSKLWFNICNAAVLVIYVKLGWNLAEAFKPGDSLEGFTFLTLVVSGILTSNKLADMLIKKKYGITDASSNIK